MINLINPIIDTTVQIYEFFTFEANVTCSGGECGTVNVTLDPEEVGLDCDTLYPEGHENGTREIEICTNITMGSDCINTLSGHEDLQAGETAQNCEDIIEQNCTSWEGARTSGEATETICNTYSEDHAEIPSDEISLEDERLNNVGESEPKITTEDEKVKVALPANNQTEIDLIGEEFDEEILETESTELTLNLPSGKEARVIFDSNVSVLKRQLLMPNKNNKSGKKIFDIEREFEYLTPILAIELENMSSAIVYLPKLEIKDINMIQKCDNWNFDIDECDSGWYNYKSFSDLMQNDKNVWFEVNSFSAYAGGNLTAGETAFLTIWDYNDIGMPNASDSTITKIANETVQFFADYELARNGTKLTNGDCSIDFDDGNASMIYNSTYTYFLYERNFTSNGDYSYTVNCTHPSYTNLSDGDSIRIGQFANSTKGAVSTITGAVPFYTINANPQQCTLKGGETCNVSWSVNVTGILNKIYDFFVEVIGLFIPYTTSSHVNLTISVNDSTVPILVSIISSPSAVINGSNVIINANVDDNFQVDNVWGIITRPDGANVSMDYLQYIYTTPSNIFGRYNVTYYANDTSGNNASSSSWFEVAESLNATINLSVDADVEVGVNISNFTFKLVHPEFGDTIFETETNGTFSANVPNIVYDVLLSEAFGGTMNLTLREVNLSANVNNSINLDKHKQESGYLVTYVINTGYSFDVSEVTFSYYGESYATEGNLQLWKCDSYDLEGRSCSGSWIDVTSSAIQNTDNNHFEYSTTSFSGFSIKEYVATVTSTGGGGGSCTYNENYDWQCGGWSFCVEGIQTRTCSERNNCGDNYGRLEVERNCEEEKIPEELFDITFSLDNLVIENNNELSGVVTFESFGTVPTPVDLTFIILNEAGGEIYKEKSDVTVTTEEILRWNYETLGELSEGKYTAILETLYNVDIYDEFRQEFRIDEEKGILSKFKGNKKVIVIIFGSALILFLMIIVVLIYLIKIKPERRHEEINRNNLLNQIVENNRQL